MDLEAQKEHFKNHVAKFTDYGNIKILDFKNPESINYRIRFIFEEDYCRLHISGDLGELSATNYNNMTYEHFKDFVHNTGYFEEKIDCHSRAIYRYDEEKASERLREIIEENDLSERIAQDYYYDDEDQEEAIKEFIGDVLEDFSDERGIGSKGYDCMAKYYDDFWEIAGDIGEESTGILNLYMLAFELAKEQIDKKNESEETSK